MSYFHGQEMNKYSYFFIWQKGDKMEQRKQICDWNFLLRAKTKPRANKSLSGNWLSPCVVMDVCWGRLHSGNQGPFSVPAQSKLRPCSAYHKPGYFGNLACDWLSIIWTCNKHRSSFLQLGPLPCQPGKKPWGGWIIRKNSWNECLDLK